MDIKTLQKDMISAMKSGDTVRKATLSSAISAIKKVAIDKNCRNDITEEIITDVLRKEIKTVTEQISTCPVDREELLQEFYARRAILQEYVPALVTDKEQITKMIHDILVNMTIVDKGQVMRLVMPILKGKVDMKVANTIINNMFEVSK